MTDGAHSARYAVAKGIGAGKVAEMGARSMERGKLRKLIRSVWRLIAALTVVLLAAGCSAPPSAATAGSSVIAILSGEADEGFARAVEPMPLAFPRDHGAHPAYQIEWWYFTGNLAGDGGAEYGYQLTFFRRALTPEMPPRASGMATNQVYMAHFALADAAAGSHVAFERFSRGDGSLAGAAGESLVAIWLEDWAVREVEPGAYRLVAAAETEAGEVVALDLTLRETRAPILHGEEGLSRKGAEPGNANYYYSLVGLETAGAVTFGERTIAVSGLSWMDHEFGTSALGEDALGWDWFSVQLADGSALMLAQLRLADGGVEESFVGTWLGPDGEQTPVRAGDYALDVLGEWVSPHTGIAYPSGWRITLPAQALRLTVTPLVRDQEMRVSYVYWEGAARVEGERGGQPVAGRGYVELTGYGGVQSGSVR